MSPRKGTLPLFDAKNPIGDAVLINFIFFYFKHPKHWRQKNQTKSLFPFGSNFLQVNSRPKLKPFDGLNCPHLQSGRKLRQIFNFEARFIHFLLDVDHSISFKVPHIKHFFELGSTYGRCHDNCSNNTLCVYKLLQIDT